MGEGSDGHDGHDDPRRPDAPGPAGELPLHSVLPVAEVVARRASLWTRGGRSGLLARVGRLEYDRILFFSDAVFAIAITLLIVDLPGHLGQAAGSHFDTAHALREAEPGIAGFWIGFAVIGLFWLGHHSLFRFITGFDRRLMLLNLLFVGLIAFLPYPTALLSTSGTATRTGVVFYAACTAAAGVVETIMWAYVCRTRHGLISPLSRPTQRLILLRTARAPAVFIVSIPVALLNPTAGEYFWLAIVVVGAVIERFYGSHDPSVEPGSPGIPDPPQ
jgi:uncharacterized membrane protein